MQLLKTITYQEFCNRLGRHRKLVGNNMCTDEQCHTGMQIIRTSYLTLACTKHEAENAAMFLQAWEDEYKTRMKYRSNAR